MIKSLEEMRDNKMLESWEKKIRKDERQRIREAVEKLKNNYTKHCFIEAEYLEVFEKVLALLNS